MRGGWRWAPITVLAIVPFAFAASAHAAVPSTPTVTEPASDQAVHPADVHMEVVGFSDPDGDAHACSDWEILKGSTIAWSAPCAADVSRLHIHLGDGSFTGPAGTDELEYGTTYTLRVRFRDSNGETGDYAERTFTTLPKEFAGGAVPWIATQPGFVVERVAGGLQLPINIAFVPDPGTSPDDPLLYVTELYGTIKVVTRSGTVSDYANGLLNFDPTGPFPGSGEQGLTGIAVEPTSGDVFASLVYEDSPGGPHYAKVIRLHSDDGGRTAAAQTDLLDMTGEPEGPSHQVSNLSFGPDGRLYVHNGDAFDPATALDLSSFRGKILRLNIDSPNPPPDNPLYDEADGIDAEDYVYAYGFRNPFGGAWRASNGAHYEVENGPGTDRLARVVPGASYGWNGFTSTMSIGALYNWRPAHAPVNIAFVQDQTFGGSGFPASKLDHAFVSEAGPTYAEGPQARGKRIVEIPNDDGGELGGGHPESLVEYAGTGRATAVGLASGPGGLYFTDLYKDLGAVTAIDPGARLMRIRYAGVFPECTMLGTTLRASVPGGGRLRIRGWSDGSITANGRVCGANTANVDSIEITGGNGRQRVAIDLRLGQFAPGPTPEDTGMSEIEIAVDLGPGHADTLVVRRGGGRAVPRRRGRVVRLNRDLDVDVETEEVDRFLVAPRRRLGWAGLSPLR